LYPAIDPYEEGLLDTGDGQSIFWEQSGCADGAAVIVLHGGPGSGCSAEMRRFFDPHAYRIVLVDQRGCGRSRPHASDPSTDLALNTTAHLLGDLELLRNKLEIEKWFIFGVSWGTVLGLAYAEQAPDRIAGLVLAGVSVGRRSEIDWLYRGGLGRFFPGDWDRFCAGAPESERGDLVGAYRRLLESPDAGVRAKAAKDWTDWDWATSSVAPSAPSGRWIGPSFQVARARICAYYFDHHLWLQDTSLVQEAGRLAGVPGVLINGRLDLQCPLGAAWELHRAWPDSTLVVVDGAGHSSGEPGMGEAIVAATDHLASTR
jgi:proline iminopeptidase